MTAGASTGLPFPLEPVVVVTGHYGVGKTNFALNLALDAAAAGYRATLADMDVVNPYFRSNEYRDLLEGAGARLIAPVFGHTGTSLDVPSVTGELAVAAAEAYRDETGRTIVIVDAGGDDVGATTLARFAPALAAGPYAMLYVVNAFRNLTQTSADAVAVLREIEAKSHLEATAVVGNSHLQGETTKCPVYPGRGLDGRPSRCLHYRPHSGHSARKHGVNSTVGHSQWLCCERVRQASLVLRAAHSA